MYLKAVFLKTYLKTEKKRSANINSTDLSVVLKDDGKCYYTLCSLVKRTQYFNSNLNDLYFVLMFNKLTKSQSEMSISSKVELICNMAASCMAPLFPILFPVILSIFRLLFFCEINRKYMLKLR